MNNLRILLVDDDTAFRKSMEVFFTSQGYSNVRVAGTGEAALEMVQQEVPGLVVLDVYLPFMNGLKTLREIHKIDKNIPVLMLSCEEDEEYRRLAVKFGAMDYLTKPLMMMSLLAYVEPRLKAREAENRLLPPAA